MSGTRTGSGAADTAQSQQEHGIAPAAKPSVGRSLVARVTGFNELGILVVLLLIGGVVGGFRPRFFSVDSLVNISQAASLYGIIALGAVFLLSMGEIDLSVGSVYAVVIMETAIQMNNGMNPWFAALVGLAMGLALGAANGILANFLRLPALIITIGTLTMFRGLSLVLSTNRYIGTLPTDNLFFRIFGGVFLHIPASVWAFAILAVLLTVLYRSTRYGFVVRAIGSNLQAARLSGIPIARIRLITLTMSGGLAALSGLLTLGYFQSADPNLGSGYELLVIASAVIGGTALAGGSGSVIGAVLGALLIAVITSALIQFGVSANWTSFVTGAVIVGAVGLDAVIRRRRRAT